MKYMFILIGTTIGLAFGCKTQKQASHTPPKQVVVSPIPAIASEPIKTTPKQPLDGPEADVVRTIYTRLPNSRILRCKEGHTGKVMYEAQMNAYDGPKAIFDENGEKKGSISTWDPNKTEFNLQDCEDLFIPEKNIWGLKPIDVFGLKD